MDQKILLYFYRLCVKKPMLGYLIDILCLCLPSVVVLLYFAVTISLIRQNSPQLFRFLLVPALTLIFVSFIRKKKNRPRPFEIISEIHPRVEHSCGESFPSRHMTSACIIAIAMTTVNGFLAFICFFLAFLIGISRISAGIHYPSDILGGVILAFFTGILFFL